MFAVSHFHEHSDDIIIQDTETSEESDVTIRQLVPVQN